jgi:hypothetical protein
VRLAGWMDMSEQRQPGKKKRRFFVLIDKYCMYADSPNALFSSTTGEPDCAGAVDVWDVAAAALAVADEGSSTSIVLERPRHVLRPQQPPLSYLLIVPAQSEYDQWVAALEWQIKVAPRLSTEVISARIATYVEGTSVFFAVGQIDAKSSRVDITALAIAAPTFTLSRVDGYCEGRFHVKFSEISEVLGDTKKPYSLDTLTAAASDNDLRWRHLAHFSCLLSSTGFDGWILRNALFPSDIAMMPSDDGNTFAFVDSLDSHNSNAAVKLQRDGFFFYSWDIAADDAMNDEQTPADVGGHAGFVFVLSESDGSLGLLACDRTLSPRIVTLQSLNTRALVATAQTCKQLLQRVADLIPDSHTPVVAVLRSATTRLRLPLSVHQTTSESPTKRAPTGFKVVVLGADQVGKTTTLSEVLGDVCEPSRRGEPVWRSNSDWPVGCELHTTIDVTNTSATLPLPVLATMAANATVLVAVCTLTDLFSVGWLERVLPQIQRNPQRTSLVIIARRGDDPTRCVSVLRLEAVAATVAADHVFVDSSTHSASSRLRQLIDDIIAAHGTGALLSTVGLSSKVVVAEVRDAVMDAAAQTSANSRVLAAFENLKLSPSLASSVAQDAAQWLVSQWQLRSGSDWSAAAIALPIAAIVAALIDAGLAVGAVLHRLLCSTGAKSLSSPTAMRLVTGKLLRPSTATEGSVTLGAHAVAAAFAAAGVTLAHESVASALLFMWRPGTVTQPSPDALLRIIDSTHFAMWWEHMSRYAVHGDAGWPLAFHSLFVLLHLALRTNTLPFPERLGGASVGDPLTMMGFAAAEAKASPRKDERVLARTSCARCAADFGLSRTRAQCSRCMKECCTACIAETPVVEGSTRLSLCRDCAASTSGEVVHTVQRWQRDEDVVACVTCHRTFNFLRRRHHCRLCGVVVCAQCSAGRVKVPGFGSTPQRVCDACAARSRSGNGSPTRVGSDHATTSHPASPRSGNASPNPHNFPTTSAPSDVIEDPLDVLAPWLGVETYLDIPFTWREMHSAAADERILMQPLPHWDERTMARVEYRVLQPGILPEDADIENAIESADPLLWPNP